MKLYTYYRSSAAYRVRIALNYKEIDCEYVFVNLNKNEHRDEAFLKHNSQGRVPILMNEDLAFGQSSAILEYIEEKYPKPPLLPCNPLDQAWVRYLSQIIISDMHPVMNNSSVVKYLKENGKLNEQQIQDWFHHWMEKGFDALELALNNSGKTGLFCLGDALTVADVCLIPQIYNAFRFNFPMYQYPTLMRIYEYCIQLPYFIKASPEMQLDYV